MPTSRTYIRAHAALRLQGEALDPMVVTAALRLPPDHTHRAGEQRFHRTRGGTVVASGAPAPHGHWSMSSEAHVRSRQLAVHIAWVLGEIEPRGAALRDLIGQGASADIVCFSEGATTRPPAVPRALRERAAALGLAIHIDHYATPAEAGGAGGGGRRAP
ncbi:MAG: DUF4279 domain-containing protein [Gemmatimonadetes bacterium]|nr:DUF4279 domain-containing protein [Gemmatimonadota bacterium]